MEWIEYTPATRRPGDWNEEIYCQGGSNQYQQQQRFTASGLGVLPDFPEDENRNDITVWNNTKYQTPVFTNLNACSQESRPFADRNSSIECQDSQQLLPGCERVMMPLENSTQTEPVSVKQERGDSIMGNMPQQCRDDENHKGLVSPPPQETVNQPNGMFKSQTTDEGLDQQQGKFTPVSDCERFGTAHRTSAPSQRMTPFLDGINPVTFLPPQLPNGKEQKLFNDNGASNVTGNRVDVSGHNGNQSDPFPSSSAVCNPLGAMQHKNITHNGYCAVPNKDLQHIVYAPHQRRRTSIAIIAEFDDVTPYPCDQRFVENLPNPHPPFYQGFNSGYPHLLSGNDLNNTNYQSKHPNLPVHQQVPNTDNHGEQCAASTSNFTPIPKPASSTDSFTQYSRPTNEYMRPPPHASIGVAPPSYTAAQGRSNSQPFYAAHGSIFRTQLPGTGIANWQQTDSYKISPQRHAWQGNFTDHAGYAYRSFAKIEAPHEWMGGIGSNAQDYTLRQGGHLQMTGDDHDLASVTEMSREPLVICEASDHHDAMAGRTVIRPKKTQKKRQRQFECTYENCRKRYFNQNTLDTHLRKHAGVRPYECEWVDCKRKFQRSDQLKRHQRKHTGERPYQCPRCEKRFARSDHLKTHKKTHEEKPFACDWGSCKKKFAHRDDFERHYKTHDPNKRPRLPLSYVIKS